MNKNRFAFRGYSTLVAAGALAFTLASCSGSDGSAGAPGPGVTSPAAATALNMSITGVTINSAPVVKFTVTNQDSSKVAGLTLSDLRFTIAKLVPGSNGTSSKWQNYINTASSGLTGGYVRGNRENNGTLVDNQDGTYTYTFKTDIANTAETCPTTPCVDPDGNALDTSYNASLTHRVAIQTRGSLPMVNAVYTFKPGSGPVTSGREIVKTETCNECHNKLELHDARIETQYCVMCHNPGSTGKGQVGTVVGPTPVDFKVMIHKIHRGAELPSVVAGGDYGIFGFSGTLESFKDVHFPQDIKNCTKCHNGTVGASNATAQGDNWKNQPNKAACSSCHDDLYFGTAGDPAKPYQTVSHIAQAAAHVPSVTVGPDPTDDTCVACHKTGGQAGGIDESHPVPVQVAAAKFQFNILQICGTAVASSPNCGASSQPTVKFSVSDPTGATTHGYGNLYDVANPSGTDGVDPEFGASSSLNILSGWMSGKSVGTVDGIDYTNDGGAGDRPARANSLNVRTATVGTPPPAGTVGVVDNADGTFTATLAAIPAVARSGVIAMEGHPRGETVVGSGTFNISIPVAGAVAYFGIGGNAAVVRRVAVDIQTKCDKCHQQLSLHGNNRADNAQLCVVCHNPRNTDVKWRSPSDGQVGLPDGGDPDGRFEESIDFKRLIHGIHAAQRDDPATAGVVEGHGFREKGLGIHGRNAGSFDDFGHIRFPGILNDCTTCHQTVGGVGTYELTGKWAAPLQNGILAVTMRAIPDTGMGAGTWAAQAGDQTNDLYRTPTAAVCSACHDGALAQAHMETIGGAVFNGNAAAIAVSFESCSVCHGPGKIADLKVVHKVP